MAIIYAACVAGAAGVFLMLPRASSRLPLLGGLLAAGALGAAFIGLELGQESADPQAGPGAFFYIFGFIAAAGGIRMITHPRPVYAALYFIMVVLATGGLFLLLAAEFMAFALVIVYAGAILVTYLFVIMLAQESPDDQHPDALAEYDAVAREPLLGVAVGFLLLAALLGVMQQGTPAIATHDHHAAAPMELEILTGTVEKALREAGTMRAGESVVEVDAHAGVVTLTDRSSSELREVPLPADLEVDNVDQVGVSLLTEFPVSLELAGVILLLAMLGAVVLARKPLTVPSGLASKVVMEGSA